jgi:hypothetical protein
MKTSKLFHSVVVLGMALAAEAACSDSTNTPTSSTSSGSSSGADADGGPLADASGDAFAGWACCG